MSGTRLGTARVSIIVATLDMFNRVYEPIVGLFVAWLPIPSSLPTRSCVLDEVNEEPKYSTSSAPRNIANMRNERESILIICDKALERTKDQGAKSGANQ